MLDELSIISDKQSLLEFSYKYSMILINLSLLSSNISIFRCLSFLAIKILVILSYFPFLISSTNLNPNVFVLLNAVNTNNFKWKLRTITMINVENEKTV
ncbi:MAG: hypothetical protein LBS15_03555 [Endomicrobium sp.]|jgi:hypothetical protein|nr:hypothetical protein [Endomicrobium sp.]